MLSGFFLMSVSSFFLENLKFASEEIYKFLLTTFVQKTLNLILQKL